MASSHTGGNNSGRDMATAARLITCVGNDCQAVSQLSEQSPESPREARYGARRGARRREEREERERENGGRLERSSTSTLFAPRDAAGKGTVLNHGPGRAYGGRHHTGGSFGSMQGCLHKP